MKLKIQGTIVSPDYDDSFFESWIAKGVITPSSRVVAALESATEPVDLYINSYGGDVFAGGEMMIALLKAHAAGRLASVEVGSLAASMAANIVAALKANGARVVGHANTQLMFHGCYTVTEGGAQLHEDVADSLRNINDAVIANLNKLGITDCRAWFAEGREEWIAAPDALEMGLLDEVAEGADSAPFARNTAARLAAFASKIKDKQEYKLMIDDLTKTEAEEKPVEASAPVEGETEAAHTDEKPVEENSEPAPAKTDETVAEAERRAKVAEDIEARATALANERFSALQAKHDKLISDLTKERDEARASLESVKADLTSSRAEVEKLNADLAAVRDQLAESERNREAVVASALTPTQPKPADGFSARQKLAALPASERAAYYAAHKAEIDGKTH